MAKPRLAGVRIRPRKSRIFEGAARDAVVAKTAAILREWTLSPFQHEASCRYGLRTALVLNGHRWAVADLEAESVVSAALAANGARRPTWWQGQAEATIPRENCARCGGPLDNEDMTRRRRFCSEECASAAKVYNESLFAYIQEEARRAAWDAANPERRREISAATYARALDQAPERLCVVCGKPFRSLRESQTTCSRACGSAWRINTAHDKTCPQCGKSFHSSRHGQRYCSPQCARDGLKASLPPRACHECGNAFQPGRPEARFCSERCRDRASARRIRAAKKAERLSST